jgi:hypothetical protein
MASVQQLHDQLQACHADVVRDALMEGAQQLLLYISDTAKSGVANLGFCRQVSCCSSGGGSSSSRKSSTREQQQLCLLIAAALEACCWAGLLYIWAGDAAGWVS